MRISIIYTFLAVLLGYFGAEAQIVVSASTETALPGQEVCVKVTVENFRRIQTFQLSHNFDPNVIQFKEIRNFVFESATNPIDLTFGTNRAEEGIVTVSYSTSDFFEGDSLADGTVFYELCFTAIGTEGQFSDIIFSDNTSAIEISDIERVLDPTLNDGRVNIGEVASGGFSISVGEVTGNMGSTVCVPFTVTGWNQMISVQHGINYDPAALRFVEVQNFIFNSQIALTFALVSEGNISFVWTSDDLVNGSTVDDGTKIFDLCFEVLAECETSTDVRLSASPVEIEISDVSGTLQGALNNGRVNSGSCSFSAVLASALNPCPGQTNGSIDISVFGGRQPYTYAWSNGQSAEDISGLGSGTYNVTVTDADNMSVSLSAAVVLSDAPIALNPTITDPSSAGASDGSIVLNISGGSEPYQIIWDNGSSGTMRNNLAEGSYSVTVTDANGCSVMETISVSLGLKVTSADITNVSCGGASDGAIDISIGGGDGNFTFSWSNGATTEDLSGLLAGSYSVTITDGTGATSNGGPYNVTEPMPISITSTITEVKNGGDGAIVLTVSGGQAPYTYNWSTGATSKDINGLDVGSYTVTITDANGCSNEFTIDVPNEEFRVTFDIVNLQCGDESDGMIEALPQNGVAPFTYSWSSGETTATLNNLPAGNYTVTVTDANSNQFTGTATVEAPEPILVTFDEERASGSTLICVDAIVRGGTPPYSFNWQPINQSTPTVCNLEEGVELTLTVTDANNCQVVETHVIGLGECYDGSQVITPNGDGLNDNLQIRCVNQNRNAIEIFNRFGQLVFETNNYANQWQGEDNNGNDLPDGAYFWVLRVTLPNGTERIFKDSVTLVRRLN